MDLKLHKQHQNLSQNHWWFKVRENILTDIAEKYFKKGGSVLDFGCNYGYSVRLLQSRGYTAQGVDLSDEAIGFGRSIDISNIYLQNEKIFPENSFDAIISLDVLEHIDDDKKTFDYLHSRLKYGGYLVIMVPAFMFLWGVQDEISHHFRRYTLPNLISLSKQAGDFEIIKKSYFNTILFLPIAFVRFFSSFFHLHTRDSDLDLNNRFINGIFFHFFDFERKILGHFNFPFGVSALLILKKK